MLYRVTYTGDASFLTKYPEHHRNDAKVVLARGITADEYAEFLDSDAENDNYQSLVGCHAGLVKLLREYLSERSVTKIMKELTEAGGIHGGGLQE